MGTNVSLWTLSDTDLADSTLRVRKKPLGVSTYQSEHILNTWFTVSDIGYVAVAKTADKSRELFVTKIIEAYFDMQELYINGQMTEKYLVYWKELQRYLYEVKP